MQTTDSEAQTPGAQTLRRGLAVLRLLTRVGPSGLRMLELARRLDFNKTTVIRLTRTLVEEGFVLHDPISGRYRLGPGAFAAGLAAEPSYELQRLAAPTLRALATISGDTVFFTVLHGYDTICLSRDEGDFPIRNQLMQAGDRWPLGVGAGAIALLAALPDGVVDDALRHSHEDRARRYPRCTDAVIRKLVRETRSQGYCVQPGLVLEDSWAVGVVVHDGGRHPVASISIAAIKSRLGTLRSLELGTRLMRASRDLTDLLVASAGSGGKPPPATGAGWR